MNVVGLDVCGNLGTKRGASPKFSMMSFVRDCLKT